MSWISIIDPDDADGDLRRLYERVRKAGNGQVDNILKAHSPRPHTLEGHMALYKAVLHHSGNVLPEWLLETIGIYVSMSNGCKYCVDHHFAGLQRLLQNDRRTEKIMQALNAGAPQLFFEGRDLAALEYAHKLTVTPEAVSEKDIAEMRDAGLGDGEILEINQVTAYFAYANRTVMGLGVDDDGEELGLSPKTSGDIADWAHG